MLQWAVLYLLVALTVYVCLSGWDPHKYRVVYAPFMLVVGAYRVPGGAWTLFLVPFVGIRW